MVGVAPASCYCFAFFAVVDEADVIGMNDILIDLLQASIKKQLV